MQARTPKLPKAIFFKQSVYYKLTYIRDQILWLSQDGKFHRNPQYDDFKSTACLVDVLDRGAR